MAVGGERDVEHGGGRDRARDPLHVFVGNTGAGVVVCDQHGGAFRGGRIEGDRHRALVVKERGGNDGGGGRGSGRYVCGRAAHRAGVALAVASGRVQVGYDDKEGT